MKKKLQPELLKKDFPIFTRKIHGKPLVYLDSAATSQKPTTVIEAISSHYRLHNANVHRGVHLLAEESTEVYEGARKKVQELIHAQREQEIIFVRNTTEAINLVAYSWGRSHLHSGDEILLTQMEHHSNLIPWQFLAKEKGVVLKFVPLQQESYLDMEAFQNLLSSKTKLVAVTHMSNVLGTINPIKEITKRAHQVKALVLVDGAQSVPHMMVDVQSLGCDFLACSGHKMLGPTGIGVLYAKKDVLEDMPPFMGGGDMIKEVYFDRATFNDLPWRFEAGTPNIADAAGLHAAVEYLQTTGLDAIREYEEELTAYALGKLQEVKHMRIYGPLDAKMKGGVISFNVSSIHPHDLSTLLDQDGIAIRAGHHCAQPLLRTLGTTATARASLYFYNTKEDIDTLVESLEKAKKTFRVT
ncbi:MAG TPA: cysteine desulfurase [Patescibacteria group bacterium]|nr:cysteine desulfurase [Patescibacteria group bacterium]